jgi:organic radical activating enzyme
MWLPSYKKQTARIMSLFLTELCNKNCYYCDIPYIDNPKDTNKDLLFKFLPIIENNGSFEGYTITGGEPGLVSIDVLDFIFNTIDPKRHRIKVNTNGTFFKNGYYDKFIDSISEVGYHPIIEPNQDLPFNCVDEKIVVYIPFHRKNMHHIPDLLKRYPLINFNPIPYISKKDFDNEDYVIEAKHILELKEKIKSFSNVANGTFTTFLTRVDPRTYDVFRLVCQNSATRYSFNFATGYIGRCPESVTLNDRMEMTEENVNKALCFKLFPKQEEITDEACKQCYYFESFYPYAMKNLLLGD